MTEVPQATAREEAVEVMTRVAAELYPENIPQIMAAVLDALLSPRTVPCETCGGRDDMGPPEGDGVHHGPCPHCTGGSVTLGPLAVLVGELVLLEHRKDVVRWEESETGMSSWPVEIDEYDTFRLPSSKEPK